MGISTIVLIITGRDTKSTERANLNEVRTLYKTYGPAVCTYRKSVAMRSNRCNIEQNSSCAYSLTLAELH